MQDDSVIYVHNVPIHIRRLPSGDLSVWHPFNDRIRQIVEPICRHRGYWKQAYNNWIVFRPFAEDVCNALREANDT